jgi:sugar/nucleoside kinase (ribokinase family)
MAIAATGLGSNITCLGLLGYPSIFDVFQSLAKKCHVISIGAPGYTQALEFSDGKIMFSTQANIPVMCWSRIKKIVGEKAFSDLIVNSDMVACTNWTSLTEIDEILENIIRIIPKRNTITFFFDLADPEKRKPSEIKRLIGQLRKIDKKSSCILGLNLREAEQISAILGLSKALEDGKSGLKKAAEKIRGKLGIKGTAIHSVSYAAASVGSETASVKGPFCRKPKITTGAGDHFNGGFCSGLLAGLSLESALYTGVANSGWYVRHTGESPGFKDLVTLLEDWAEGRLKD